MKTNHPNKTVLGAAASEFAIEFGHWTEVKKDAEVEAEGGDVAAELPAGAFGETFGGLQFHDDALLNQHIDAMEADLLTTEGYGNRVLAIDLKPSTS